MESTPSVLALRGLPGMRSPPARLQAPPFELVVGRDWTRHCDHARVKGRACRRQRPTSAMEAEQVAATIRDAGEHGKV